MSVGWTARKMMRSRMEEEKLVLFAIMVWPLRSSNGRLRANNDAIVHNRRTWNLSAKAFPPSPVPRIEGKGGDSCLKPLLPKISKNFSFGWGFGTGDGSARFSREAFSFRAVRKSLQENEHGRHSGIRPPRAGIRPQKQSASQVAGFSPCELAYTKNERWRIIGSLIHAD